MQPTSRPAPPESRPTQRELLALVLGRARERSAGFRAALDATGGAPGDPAAHELARELLSDLAIRDWIEIRRDLADGGEAPVARLRYELELADPGNWESAGDQPRARYALTEKGRAQLPPAPDPRPG